MKHLCKKSIVALSLITMALYCQILAKDSNNNVRETPTVTQDESFSDNYC